MNTRGNIRIESFQSLRSTINHRDISDLNRVASSVSRQSRTDDSADPCLEMM